MLKKLARILAMLLAVILSLGATASLAEPATILTEESLQAMNGGAAIVHTHDGRVTFVEGTCAEAPVGDMESAGRVVESMIPLLGGDGRTQFEPWREVTDTNGNHYYVFQQMYAGTTVSGGAVKVVTDADGAMLGLVSSVESELPEAADASQGIDAQAAEAQVLRHFEETAGKAPVLVEGHTCKVILPVNLELDMQSDEETEESRYVWVVYTDNPSTVPNRSVDLPYLANYVDMSGAFLYSLPTIIPDDEAGRTGFDAAYVFEFMEPVEYTGTVTLSDGSQREISLELMRDSRTGMVYLGNLERRIAVADCYEFLYNKGRVVLEASKDNTGWDSTCLLALYNYCRAWDYYKAIGWIGGDGRGTPMLILKDFCDEEHNSVDNAAYAGLYYGWQLFLSSGINDFSQCLDVLAHEMTHCVTGALMTYNAYMNDYGAINEAISDIQGNICDLMNQDEGEADDAEWRLGEDGKMTVRSMSDPHRYRQPEFAWDVYYSPAVKDPTDLNDRGGVHGNSSLLNRLAWQLCAEGGMSLEEARAYWFAVDCAMVPGVDYAQLSELLPWVLKNLGMEAYGDALEAAMDKTRIRSDAMPETFDDDRALVTMTLPDTEQFRDGNWALAILSLNLDGLVQRSIDILDGNPGCEDALDELARVLEPEGKLTHEEIPEAIGKLIMAFFDESLQSEGSSAKATVNGLYDWLRKYYGDMFYGGLGAAGQDGGTVRMVCRPGLTVPVMLRLEYKPNSTTVKSAGLALYFGRWYDVGGLLAEAVAGNEEAQETEAENPWLSLLDEMLDSILEAEAAEPRPTPEPEEVVITLEDARNILVGVREMLNNLSWVKAMFFYEIKPGQVCVIPNDGLEKVAILDEEIADQIFGGMVSSSAEKQDQPDQ